ncbi:family 1 glycosylhydrolase [Paenibacillus sp. MMS20-IR301]|uniref:glycoside hydrolase family 1 protein n=1 Tax=Paenibacillus sp. MMS20-IR301 TaxID=2895946 RepID=UPI0028E3D6A8|nr:family 1 glycosylhydrolase [Paenibacillus sp. MMS20-IR301]WNS45340.1 family 1 glycosylhydrolase [Paenibacillus sp. MMS20-IR301]
MPQSYPENFLWGTATSAHQVEGNNINADLWAEEHAEGSPYRDYSGDAINHYQLYREDILLLAGLGLNSYRFSIEWARIEPEPGIYSSAEIGHYRDVLQACKENGITPVVTMHHFTSPRWLMRFGGWKNPQTADRFAQYCETVFSELGQDIPYVVTMNEANLPVLLKELFVNLDFMPPVGIDGAAWTAPGWREAAALRCGTTIDKYFTFHMASDEQSLPIVMDAHKKARTAIKALQPAAKVGLSLALPDVQSVAGGEAYAAGKWYDYFGQYKDAIAGDDFLGVQNYAREVYGPQGLIQTADTAEEITGMGTEFYPEALAGSIRRVASELTLPIMVTEHGIATEDDSQRIRFISRGLQGLEGCIADGIPVLGYMYWSAFDNFEWTFGYGPHFGVIAVNRDTQERHVKESAHLLGAIARRNTVRALS